MDDILLKGNEIYVISRKTKNIAKSYLNVEEVCDKFNILNTKINIQLESLENGKEVNTLFFGLQGEILGRGGEYSLEYALQHFFTYFEFGVITTTNSISVAIFKINNIYYYFDSHPRGAFGQFVQKNGTSTLCGYSELVSLFHILKYNFLYGNLIYSGMIRFSIQPVNVKLTKLGELVTAKECDEDEVLSEKIEFNLKKKVQMQNDVQKSKTFESKKENNAKKNLDSKDAILIDKKSEYNRNYKSFLRSQSKAFKMNENVRRRQAHKQNRSISPKRIMENLDRRERHRTERKDPKKKSLENVERRERHIVERKDPRIRSLENLERKERHIVERKDPRIRSLENLERKERHIVERKDHEKRFLENTVRKEKLEVERKNPENRFRENIGRKIRHKLERNDPVKRTHENLKRKIERRLERNDNKKRLIDNEGRRQRHLKSRKDLSFREKENFLRKMRMKKASDNKISNDLKKNKISNKIDKKIEKKIKSKYSGVDQTKFENQILMFRDRLKRSLKIKINYKYKKNLGNKNFKMKIKKMKDKNRTLLEYFSKRKQVTEFICGCCEGKFFKHNVKKLNIDRCKYKNKSDLEDFLKISQYCCTTCHLYLNRNKLPTLAIKNGLEFPEIPDCLKDLSDLEERMVAPIINFMEIRELKKYALNPQKGLKGSVVHIPVEINDMVKVLPRRFDNMGTVQIKLKRHEDYKNHYMFETVRIKKVLEAINYLINTPLYKSEGITVDPNYLKDIEDKEIEFISDPADKVKDGKENDPRKTKSPKKKEDPPEIFTLSGKTKSQPPSLEPIPEWNIQDIRNTEVYVTNHHITRFIDIINKCYTNNYMFPTDFICDMGLKHVKAKGRNKRNVQILFLEPKGNDKIGHWVTTVHKNKTIYVYDSLDWKSLNEICLKFLKKMYPTTMKNKNSIKYMKTCQQNDSYSCGVHAIANSVALLNNIDPSNLCYKIEEMRDHLYNILKTEDVSMFPIDPSISIEMCEEIQNNENNSDSEDDMLMKIAKLIDDCVSPLNKRKRDEEESTEDVNKEKEKEEKPISQLNKKIKIEKEEDKGKLVDIFEDDDNIPIPNEDVMLLDLDAYEAAASKIKIMAPGQGKKPIYFDSNKNLEELSFPKIYCGEKYRIEKIYYHQRVKSELRRKDPRCRIPKKVLYMTSVKLRNSVTSTVNTCLRKSKNVQDVTAGDALSDKKMDKLVEVDDGFRFLKNNALTPAYNAEKQQLILAMVRQLGKPHLFLTITCSEMHCPELLQNLAKQSGKKLSPTESMNLEKADRTLMIQNDPVSCVRYFSNKSKNLMKMLTIDPNEKPGKCGPFGDNFVIDYFERVEFQMRGSPHMHILLWCKDIPDFDQNNPESVEKTIKFIDKIATCKYKDPKKFPLIKRQMHRHSETCYKGKRKRCRFNIPIPPMDKTEILWPFTEEESKLQNLENLKLIYVKIENEVKNFSLKFVDMSFDDFMLKLGITREKYILAIRSRIKRPRVFLKRSTMEVNINAYNEDILNYTESNMDIQPVCEVYALAKYLVDYVTKVDSALAKILKDISDEIKVNKNYTLQERMRKYASAFLNSKLVSAQEAAYYCLSIPMTQCSRSNVYINTRPINERTRMLKQIKQLRQLPPDSKDIFAQDIIQKYQKRKQELNDVTLIEYAADYTEVKRSKEEDDSDDEKDISVRKRSKIVRFKRYDKLQDEHQYYRMQCLLYFPFRDEKTEIEDADCKQIYLKNFEAIKQVRDKFNFISEEEVIEAMGKVRDVNSDDDDDDPVNKPVSKSQEFHFTPPEEKPGDKKPRKYITPVRITKEELCQNMQSLNEKQRQIVMHIYKCFTSNTLPIRIFLSGSAGVGKTRVINCLYQLITHHFDNLPNSNPESMKVLLCAPSGMAAFLINGMTLHLAFALPNTQNPVDIDHFSEDIANTIRCEFKDVKLIVIDEVSMVGSNTSVKVSQRLIQIVGVHQSFGGISVIFVGDLNQIAPVGDKSIFRAPDKSNAGILDINPLWEEFKYFELTEIMRQKDDLNFTNALNNLAIGKMTEKDISLIRSRTVKNVNEVPPEAIRLFATRRNVDEFNERKIANYPGELHTFVAIDKVMSDKKSKPKSENEQNKILKDIENRDPSKSAGAVHTLHLKLGIKYMIIKNIDVSDGLVNGAAGILRHITFDSKNNIGVIWLEFLEDRVGKKITKEQRYQNYLKKHNLKENLVPLEKCNFVFRLNNKTTTTISRTQFPVMPAEAITIHKSQGQTYQSICLDFTKLERITLCMTYVALSRVTSLNGLYIIGTFIPQRLSHSGQRIINEIHKLRTEKRLKDFFEDVRRVDPKKVKICYQNIVSLHKHFNDIDTDSWYKCFNIVIFSETKTHKNYSIPSFKGYNVLYRQDNEIENIGGLLCLIKNEDKSKINVIAEDTRIDHTKKFSLSLFALEYGKQFYIISGYKSPKVPFEVFKNSFETIYSKIPKYSEIILIGDFNFNLSANNTDKRFLKYVAEYNLETKLNPEQATTKYDSQIDVVLSNIPEHNFSAGIYESYFSDHRPVYCIVGENEQAKKPDKDIEKSPKRSYTPEHLPTPKVVKVPKPSDSPTTSKKVVKDKSPEKPINPPNKGTNIPEPERDNCWPPDFVIDFWKDYDITSATQYVVTDHIYRFMDILNEKYPEFKKVTPEFGFSSVDEGSKCPVIPPNRRHLQIIATNENVPNFIGHYTLAVYNGNDIIDYYDSLNGRVLNQQAKNILSKLHPHLKPLTKYIRFNKVMPQPDNVMCGIFAMANAVSYVLGKDPCDQKYIIPRMRDHLKNILESGVILPFPTE
ncbi:uncharacterized protein LOC129788528 [Lutzomyia longipalpis]|uniref:uncharacterized protein LOC129788528 n=1 Tax=Lutzomyia longipalpis TaxID=7200 RepID=UPI002483FF08|nr:uncharacterized protein LOC129788528 [Lutzomyia longipalpis]XP_055680640.1 uncharacterized protein LOC129788528 [Lutzomyia longipalpis]